jgi:hypothetical protein
MDEGYEKEKFKTFKFKESVAKKFRRFCKTMSKSQSITLLLMLDFFEVNGISPKEKLGANMNTLENRIKKRINALIAIVKDIEKNEIKPTNAMMQALFQETPIEDETKEEYNFEEPTLITENEELTYYRKEYYKNQENYNSLKYDVQDIIKKTKYIKSNFGAGYFRLEFTKEKFEQLKQKLTNVHHHNTTEIRK